MEILLNCRINITVITEFYFNVWQLLLVIFSQVYFLKWITSVLHAVTTRPTQEFFRANLYTYPETGTRLDPEKLP